MAVTETELLRLVGMIYEAATDPDLWPDFLEGYRDVLAADLDDDDLEEVALYARFRRAQQRQKKKR